MSRKAGWNAEADGLQQETTTTVEQDEESEATLGTSSPKMDGKILPGLMNLNSAVAGQVRIWDQQYESIDYEIMIMIQDYDY